MRKSTCEQREQVNNVYPFAYTKNPLSYTFNSLILLYECCMQFLKTRKNMHNITQHDILLIRLNYNEMLYTICLLLFKKS